MTRCLSRVCRLGPGGRSCTADPACLAFSRHQDERRCHHYHVGFAELAEPVLPEARNRAYVRCYAPHYDSQRQGGAAADGAAAAARTNGYGSSDSEEQTNSSDYPLRIPNILIFTASQNLLLKPAAGSRVRHNIIQRGEGWLISGCLD